MMRGQKKGWERGKDREKLWSFYSPWAALSWIWQVGREPSDPRGQTSRQVRFPLTGIQGAGLSVPSPGRQARLDSELREEGAGAGLQGPWGGRGWGPELLGPWWGWAKGLIPGFLGKEEAGGGGGGGGGTDSWVLAPKYIFTLIIYRQTSRVLTLYCSLFSPLPWNFTLLGLLGLWTLSFQHREMAKLYLGSQSLLCGLETLLG